MKKIKIGSYILASTLLFWVGFPPNGILPALFLCFLPVLKLQDILADEPKRVRWLVYWFNFACWHLATVWWVSHAHPIGILAPAIIHSSILALAFVWIDWVRKWKPMLRLPAFVLSLMAFEKLIISWDLEFPWLIMGNGLAEWTSLAQWYAFTGVFGGSLWLFVTNAGVYQLLESNSAQQKRKWLIGVSLWVLLPAIGSMVMLQQFHQTVKPVDSLTVTVFQPNIDPYGAKFQPALYRQQLDTLLQYCDTLPIESQLLIWPETALPGDYDLTPLSGNWQNGAIDSFLNQHHSLYWMTGINGFQFFPSSYQSLSAKPAGNGTFYEVYNAALMLKANEKTGLYNKRKRVVGVEKTPYLQALAFLKNTALDLGGMAGNLGDLPYKGLMKVQHIPVVPIICYESVFPDLVAEMTKEGGQLLTIITNDGWWGNTPGYQQHFLFARLRAIENRRWIARSANTGISGFIGPDGQAYEQLSWGVRGMLTRKLPLLNTTTFFSQTGDRIGSIASWLLVSFFLFSMAHYFQSKNV